VIFFGAARFVLALPVTVSSQRSPVLRSPISAFNDSGTHRILAVVSDYPDVRDTSTLLRLSVVQVAALNDKGQPKAPVPARGLLLAMLPGKAGYQYGDKLLLEGKPVTPPENEEFSYREYLARQGVYTYLTYPRVEYISEGNGSPPPFSACAIGQKLRSTTSILRRKPRSWPASCWAWTATCPQTWRARSRIPARPT
jgi:hypothetical protein